MKIKVDKTGAQNKHRKEEFRELTTNDQSKQKEFRSDVRSIRLGQ